MSGDARSNFGHKVAVSHTRDPTEPPIQLSSTEGACGSADVALTTVKVRPHLKAFADGFLNQDWRRGRAASGNLIPVSTGSTNAVAKVIPEAEGWHTDMAFGVATMFVAVKDMTSVLVKPMTYAEICAVITRRPEDNMKGFFKPSSGGRLAAVVLAWLTTSAKASDTCSALQSVSLGSLTLYSDEVIPHQLSSFKPLLLMALMFLAIGISIGWTLRTWYDGINLVPPVTTSPELTTATKCTQSQTRYTYWRLSPRFVLLAEHEQGCWELAR